MGYYIFSGNFKYKPKFYEAVIDGANRWKTDMAHNPSGMMPVIVLTIVLSMEPVGCRFRAANLYNAMVQVSDILDTAVLAGDSIAISVATAVGLFKFRFPAFSYQLHITWHISMQTTGYSRRYG